MPDDPRPIPHNEQLAYLGDGLYATFDGFQIWLTADRDGRTHTVAVERRTFDALLAYAHRVGLSGGSMPVDTHPQPA